MIAMQHLLQTTAISSIVFAGVPIDSFFYDLPEYSQTPASIQQLENYDPYSIVSMPLFSSERKLQIINNFASNLLINTKESPVEFAQMLDEHFWDLI